MSPVGVAAFSEARFLRKELLKKQETNQAWRAASLTGDAAAWIGPIVLLAAVVAVNLWLWSDRQWVEMVLEHDVRSALTPEEAEDAEAAREAMWTALDSGAVGIPIAGRSLWVLTRSHVLFLTTLLPLLGLLDGRWEALRPCLLGALRALPILACGVLLNALLRYWCLRLNATFSLAFFLPGYDGRVVWHQLAIHFDFFLIAFILRIANVASRTFQRGTPTVVGLLVAHWFGLNLAAFLLGFSFELSF